MAKHDHSGMSHTMPEAPRQYGEAFQRYATEMNTGMSKMMADMHAPGYTGDPDIDFLAMMIPHHEGAVDMARRLADLKRGMSRSDPEGYPALGGTRGKLPVKR